MSDRFNPQHRPAGVRSGRRLPTSELLRGLRQRRDIHQELLALSRGQRPLIEQGNSADLLVLLARKQQVLRQLNQLHLDAPGLRESWLACRESLALEVREDCEHVLAETESILRDLLHEEEEATNRLLSRRSSSRMALVSVDTRARLA